MQLDALQKELAKGKIRPAYLLAGEEALIRDDALASLRAAILDGLADDFNHDRLDGPNATPRNLEEAVGRLPIMAERRLVHLHEPDGRRAAAKLLLDALADLVGRAAEFEGTVLVVTAAKADKRSRWVKAFGQKPAALVECDAPKGAKNVIAFVNAEAARQDLELGSGAAEALAERIGPQLLLLRNELAKAALVAGPGTPVNRSHVEESVSQVAEESVWDLTDAIGDGRSSAAVVLLARILETGTPSPMLLGTLASHFRKLARVRGGADVPGPPFVKKKLERQARRYTSAQLLKCLREIHRTDLALKGAGELPQDLVLERLVLGLAG